MRDALVAGLEHVEHRASRQPGSRSWWSHVRSALRRSDTDARGSGFQAGLVRRQADSRLENDMICSATPGVAPPSAYPRLSMPALPAACAKCAYLIVTAIVECLLLVIERDPPDGQET